MKRLSQKTNRAMTLIELLVVIAVAALVVIMILPLRPNPAKAQAPVCFNNLRHIAVGFLMYAGDNHGKLPMTYSITNGGTMEFLQRQQTYPHFQKLAEYIQNTATFVCPQDVTRHPATNFGDFTDANLSYFLNADVSTNNSSTSILAGDRQLEANGQPVPSGLFILTTNLDLSFARGLHPFGGTLAFADGHGEMCRATNLNTFVKLQNVAVSRLSIP